MVLLQAIGAWISDGLILYIHFSNDGGVKGTAGGVHLKLRGSIRRINCENPYTQYRDRRIVERSNFSLSEVKDMITPRKETIYTKKYLQAFESKDDHRINLHRKIMREILEQDETLDEILGYGNDTLKDGFSDISNDASKSNDSVKEIPISTSTIESRTGYLAILAIVRLILLTLPLSYAAYFGTRVPCVICHYLFHAVSSLVVICHMLAILIISPLSTTIEGNTTITAEEIDQLHSTIGENVIGMVNEKIAPTSEDSSQHEEAWAILCLSLLSILLHFLIVLHLRSTGPTTQDWLYKVYKHKRKRMAYAIVARSNSFRGKIIGGHDAHANGNHDDEENESDETLSPLLLPGNGVCNEAKGIANSTNKSINIDLWRHRFRCLPEQYEAFISEAQARLDAARSMWGARLEDVKQSLKQNTLDDGPFEANDAGNNEEIVTSSHATSTNLITQAIHTAAFNATQFQSKLVRPDPFKVLLQLYAYEDIWTNNRLDQAFTEGLTTNRANSCSETEDSRVRYEELSFYAPQLLSFLLHGAYFDISSKLEEWIMKMCSRDLHFAHRCFWHLRAWCLGTGLKKKRVHLKRPSASGLGSSSISLNENALSLEPGKLALSEKPFSRLHGSESNLYLSYCQGLLTGAHHQSYCSASSSLLIDKNPPLSESLTWVYSNENSVETEIPIESLQSKLSLDEQILIEQLLLRVIQQGSKPAVKAQYGGFMNESDEDDEMCKNFTLSPSALARAGLIPIDPRNGLYSTRHLDCIACSHKYGFLPLNSSGEPYQQQTQFNDATSLFFSAPLFLDALLSIADDLMNTSRVNRTAELRKRLCCLEVELLPSNVIYLPIKKSSHRVWRIVADESLAISTNERVPCIICLEVIDYPLSTSIKQTSNNSFDESAITFAWVNNTRPPKRHSTLIDKMAKYTQEGLRRLEDTIDHLSNHAEGKSVTIQKRLGDSRRKYARLPTVQPVRENKYKSDHDEESPNEALSLFSSPVQRNEEYYDNAESPSYTPPDIENKMKSADDTIGVPPQPNILTFPSTPMSTKSEEVQESTMGQWSTPVTTQRQKLKIRKRSTNDITYVSDEYDSETISPQAKQRKVISGSPSSKKMTRSNSAPDIALQSAQNVSAPTVVFKEDWKTKTERLRKSSIYGTHKNWSLLPILIKSNDDLRQEQLASQLIQRMTLILAKANVPVWLYPYEIIALTDRGGIIECVPDTISIDSLKRNDPNFTNLQSFFVQHFGPQGSDQLSNAKANFVESLAAYSIVCFLMQIKDRHNGNILLDNKGHIIHIDFGFYFLSSPGKNSGFESAPFKLTRDFVRLMDGPKSHTFAKFRELCHKTFIELRKNCHQIILLVEMLMEGNEDLPCFRGTPEEAVKGLKERFQLDLNDLACLNYVDSLIDESLENWRTRWYDRYQRFCVGVM